MTNIQDFVMLHVGYESPTVIGAYCSITHHCTLHGCTIGDNTLVGINSTLMDGCVVGANCIIGGHTILTEGTVIPDNSVVLGAPGKVRKTLNSYVGNRFNAELYHRNAVAYAAGRHTAWQGAGFDAAMAAKRRELEAEFARLYGA
jgi:carbonic anhydrase/acetyltransferase-like protein (isoleucine patch superfamily)